ncbi:hypothetical protein A3Q56_04463 [Intoshia linei]|uniref:Uncharacterized protein n=1 Tax=Intoshia linei TaxID=1819745 RepID=A0A177B0J4_9BILA|nr:hypothetical protein A3Q56_04463 [Intoshia linei]
MSGQTKYRFLNPLFLRKADAVLIVYDIKNLESFFSVEEWLNLFTIYNDRAIINVIANKNDLVNQYTTIVPSCAGLETCNFRNMDVIFTKQTAFEKIEIL